MSSVLEFSLHCSISSRILEAILYMFPSPSGPPGVSHASSMLVVGCPYLVSFDNIIVCKLHSFKWFYTGVFLFSGIFYVDCMEVSRVFVKQLDPSRHYLLGFTINSF